jgi:hypothetical protein
MNNEEQTSTGSSNGRPTTRDAASNSSPRQPITRDANVAAGVQGGKVTDVSLWDIAYDTLAASNHDLLIGYEHLLIQVLIQCKCFT